MRKSRSLVLAALIAAMAALQACEGRKEAPPPVKVAAVLQEDVPIFLEAIGQTRGSTEIEVRALVNGYIQSVKCTNPDDELKKLADDNPSQLPEPPARASSRAAPAQPAPAKQ